MLTPDSLSQLQTLLAELGLDGWLLYDFQGCNPIAAGVLQLEGMMTRRLFGFVPATGVPIAIASVIEPGPWSRWPKAWVKRDYRGWADLEPIMREVLRGKHVAMAYSHGNAIPYLDRVSAGVLELVRASGATVVPSTDLVTRFFAVWSEADLVSHRRAAEVVAALARQAIRLAGPRAEAASPITEYELRQWLMASAKEAGLVIESPPIVAAGENSANVHYDPSPDRPRPIVKGDVLLVDLWAREPTGPYADQTWMASIGPPSARMLEVWDAGRTARDAVISFLVTGIARGQPLRGADAHDVARRVLAERGFGNYGIGRAGHSIDTRQVHGAGPNLDSVEIRDDRLLAPGTASSVEPGIYLSGEFGMRSEVNAYLTPNELIVTPVEVQRELLTA